MIRSLASMLPIQSPLAPSPITGTPITRVPSTPASPITSYRPPLCLYAYFVPVLTCFHLSSTFIAKLGDVAILDADQAVRHRHDVAIVGGKDECRAEFAD